MHTDAYTYSVIFFNKNFKKKVAKFTIFIIFTCTVQQQHDSHGQAMYLQNFFFLQY